MKKKGNLSDKCSFRFTDGLTTVFANSSKCIANCHKRRLICDVFATFDKLKYITRSNRSLGECVRCICLLGVLVAVKGEGWLDIDKCDFEQLYTQLMRLRKDISIY